VSGLVACIRCLLLNVHATVKLTTNKLTASRPRVGPEQSPLIPSLPHLLLYIVVSFAFSFPPFLLALSIFLLFHPFSPYQNSPTPFPGRMS